MHNIEHMTPIGVVEVGATLVLASGKLHIHCDYETQTFTMRFNSL